MEYAIETHALVKDFGKTRALAGVTIKIPRGTVYGVLGPNGAGKTTLLRTLATLLRPTSGQAKVLGHDVVADAKAVRAAIALTGQFASVDEDLTGTENLVLIGRLQGLSRAACKARAKQLLAGFELTEAAGRQVRTYSGGMRRRLDVAASLVVRPEVLFLDEPTTGLDPRSRNEVWDVVRAIAAGGTTVLLTTQYLEEADRLADRLAVIDHGRLIAEGTSRELKASVGGRTLQMEVHDPAKRDMALKVLTAALHKVPQKGTEAGALSMHTPDDASAAKALAALAKAGIEVERFALGSPSLDDVFFALTGKPAEPQKDEGQAGPPAKGRKARKPTKEGSA